ncbi:MAG TPA: glycerophosphodiester phosphodiesterase [Gaiellaceae bacterium]|jgi:glycerophosphoryl diester phosphodiesterase
MKLIRPAGAYWKVAHRGASALAPENSLAAIEAALAAGVDFVELDVIRAGDELRIAHSLRQLVPNSPTLNEALALFAAQSAARLDLDLKTSGVERPVLEALAAHDLLGRTLVTSFHQEILRTVRRLEPQAVTGVSYPNDSLGLSRRRPLAPLVRPGLSLLRCALPFRIGRMVAGAQADAAMLHHALVTSEVVARCHAAGAAVFAWTLESRQDLRRVLAAGADGAIADDPGIFAE